MRTATDKSASQNVSEALLDSISCSWNWVIRTHDPQVHDVRTRDGADAIAAAHSSRLRL